MSEFKLEYEIEDGYAGKSRPQSKTFHLSEWTHLVQNGELSEANRWLIEDEIYDYLRDRINFSFDNLEELFDHIIEEAEEEDD